MTAAAVAWDEASVFQLPDSGYVWGYEFELVPAGTMFAGQCLLHGLLCLEAQSDGEDNYSIVGSDDWMLIGTRDTETRELEGYVDDIKVAFARFQSQNRAGADLEAEL